MAAESKPTDRATAIFDAAVDALEKAGLPDASSSEREQVQAMLLHFFTESSGSAAAAAHSEEGANDGADEAPAQAESLHDRLPARMRLFRQLSRARKELRVAFPFSASTGESVKVPPLSSQFDPSVPHYDIDSFLFDDEDLDNLVDAGLVHRHFCKQCGSSEHLHETQFISHSFSMDQLLFLGGMALPEAVAAAAAPGPDKPLPFTVVDVGSRLGVVLAMAACSLQRICTAYRKPLNVRGIEINPKFCDIARRMLTKLGHTAPRTDVVECDALGDTGLRLIRSANVVVLHNVFEWFVPFDEQLGVWERVRDATRADTSNGAKTLIVVPPLKETLEPLILHELQKRPHKGHRSESGKQPQVSEREVATRVAEFTAGWVERVDTSDMITKFMSDRAEGDAESEGDIVHTHESLENIGVYRVLA